MQVLVNTKAVEILTGSYQVSGKLEIRGNPAVFLNDNTVRTLAVLDATVTPLAVGTSVGPMSVAKFYVPKAEPQVVLIDMTIQEAQLLSTKIDAVCFTDSYIVRGEFSTGPETKPPDLFTASAGPFFPAQNAEVLPVRPLTEDLGGQADLVFVRGDAVRVFYSPDEA